MMANKTKQKADWQMTHSCAMAECSECCGGKYRDGIFYPCPCDCHFDAYGDLPYWDKGYK